MMPVPHIFEDLMESVQQMDEIRRGELVLRYESPLPVAKRVGGTVSGWRTGYKEPADLAVSQHGSPIGQHHATDVKKTALRRLSALYLPVAKPVPRCLRGRVQSRRAGRGGAVKHHSHTLRSALQGQRRRISSA